MHSTPRLRPALRTFIRITLATLLGVVGRPDVAVGQVRRIGDMTAAEIARLDKSRTVVIITGAILEEHGPYLPINSDGFNNEHEAAAVADAIARRPGWTALLFPTIPLGAGAANEVGGRATFPGSFTVRPATLRDVFMDLGSELGEQGFRWVFVIADHGSPFHNAALDDAAAFFRDTFGGHMVHLTGLLVPDGRAEIMKTVDSVAIAANGLSVHAGLEETSVIQALRPDLVSAEVQRAPDVTGTSVPALIALAMRPEWPGYFGAPRFANADLGRRLLDGMTEARVQLAEKILDGLDERTIPRYTTMMLGVPGIDRVQETSAARDARIAERERRWLATHRH